MLNFSEDILKRLIIVFSDESRFSFMPDCHKFWVKDDDMSENATTRCRKYPISTMIWAAIGKDVKSKLIFIDKSINEDRYKEVLDESMILNELSSKTGQWKYFFQQDGATCHMKKYIFNYINKYARILNGWPPNSPDLSPIENLWAIMKNLLSRLGIKPKNKKELRELIQKVYDEIEIDTINNLIESLEYRLKMCLDVGGKTIAHFLRKNFNEIPEKYILPSDKCPPILTPELCFTKYKENLKTPHRWKKILERIEPIQKLDRMIIKNKSNKIERKIVDYNNHKNIITRVPYEIEKIIEFLNDKSNNEDENDLYLDEYEEEEEYDNDWPNDDETMNPF